PRILTNIMNALEEAGQNDIRDRLFDETLRYPRRHPHAFYWLAKRLHDDETLSDRANYNLLFQLLDALTHDEFAPVRARLKDLFDKGGLAVRIVMGQENEEGARKLVETLDRYGALEEYRRDTLKQAAHMKYPTLRKNSSATPPATSSRSWATTT